MRADSLHLTLAFIGEVDAVNFGRLLEIGARIRAPAFRMALDSVSLWRHNRIIWAGCTTPPSREVRLSEALAQALKDAGFLLDARPHAPHVTLVRKAEAEAPLPAMGAPIGWDVDYFSLVESHRAADGSRYRICARWPLEIDDAGAAGIAAGIG